MSQSAQTTVFGKRREGHTVIIARGDEIRHFTVRPWIGATLGCVIALCMIGYLLATSYLVVRDDLIGATVARQARMQQAYEDRISSLRAQVDRITSRQLLDQQLMENKVSELLSRQSQLTSRHGRLGPILERAGVKDGELPGAVPTPDARPDKRAQIDPVTTGTVKTALAEAGGFAAFWKAESKGSLDTPADRADRLFLAINKSLRSIEEDQLRSIRALTENAHETTDAIQTALSSAGLKIDADYDEKDVGGPLIPVPNPSEFESGVAELDAALQRLETVKSEARKLPIANPAKGHPISSSFGVRKDPILGTPAMHAGMDFRATTGTTIRATAPGKVISAGRNGGYGNMVEVQHAEGWTTRFAHMSRITVSVGDRLKTGDKVGEVGSTGRSTGPHLHYEIRTGGKPVNPLQFLKAGARVEGLL